MNDKAVGNKPNLYSLFTETCFNLLGHSGKCGIVVQSGLFSDLGTKKLRETLFNKAEINGIFGFNNHKGIFSEVHRSFKFIILTLNKQNYTTEFPTAFMRQDINELERFPNPENLVISVDLIRQISPDSLSISEFKNLAELKLSSKLLNHPFLTDSQKGWGINLYGEELNMTRSKQYFKIFETGNPVYEGGMIWHFNHCYSKPRYWIIESEIRNLFLNKRQKRIKSLKETPEDLKNDYEAYRLAIRKIARSEDSRSLISTIIPPYAFAGNSLSVNFPFHNLEEKYNELQISNSELLCLTAVLNSLIVDHVLRQRINSNLNLFYLNQLPVPRLYAGDRYFNEIVERAAKLICTTPEFDDLAQEVGLGSHQNGVTDETERAKLRAELDGMIAHLYGLTEDEFKHILSTFPIVPEATKQAALEAYKTFTPLTGDPEIINLITQGESAQLEFKSSARWDMRENKQNKVMEEVILKTVAGFLNSHQGGTVLIGVDDDGNILGLNHDYQTLKKKNRDGYQLFLINDLLLKELGKDLAPYLQITFHEVEGQEVCRIILNPSPRPAYLKLKDSKSGQTKECFFIRTGNLTSQLDNPSEIHNYCKNRCTLRSGCDSDR
uniref:Helix-turn-helix domain-containing protein n=1 Tax=Desertifilum tharense IPPAS B-1220 TaxID=1781255 RepID=A0ACD5H2U0_9CYAN